LAVAYHAPWRRDSGAWFPIAPPVTRVVAGVELVQKIIKGQFDVPESFGNDPFAVWYNVLAA